MSQTFHDRAGLAGAAPSLVHRLLRPLAHGMQQLPFAGKAWLISLCFLLPLGLLYGAYWQQTWQAMGGLRQEQAGLRMLREMEPWLVEAQRQRRRQMAGEQERLDWPALDAHARQWRAQAHSGRWPALAMAWEGVEAAHKTLAAQQHRPLDSTQVDALEGYVKAIRAFRSAVMDASGLALDAEQASYYMALLVTEEVSSLVEMSSRSRAMAARTRTEDQGASMDEHRLYAIWQQGQDALQSLQSTSARIVAADARYRQGWNLASVQQAGQAFLDQSRAAWFDQPFSPSLEHLNPVGQQLVDEARSLAQACGHDLSVRLAEREQAVIAQWWWVTLMTAACVLLALCAFGGFYWRAVHRRRWPRRGHVACIWRPSRSGHLQRESTASAPLPHPSVHQCRTGPGGPPRTSGTRSCWRQAGSVECHPGLQ